MSWHAQRRPKTKRTAAAEAPAPLGLTAIVEARRRELGAMKGKLPAMREKLRALTEQAEGLTERWQRHERMDLENEAEALRALIDDVATDTPRRQYEARVAPYVEAMRREEEEAERAASAPPAPPPPSLGGVGVKRTAGGAAKTKEGVGEPKPPAAARPPQRARRKQPNSTREVRNAPDAAGSIRDEFLAQQLGGDPASAAVSTVFVVSGQTCPACGEKRLRKQAQESTTVCDACGASAPLLEATTSALGYNDDSSNCDLASFSYKRVNHFSEWTSCTQGKESTEIPPNILEKVMDALCEQRLTKEQITPEHVRQALKQARLRRFYENTPLIHSLITGKPPPRFTPSQEAKLKAMFLLIQAPFDEHVASVEPKRKNFLSYSFVLFKMCQLLGLDDFLDHFALLKGAEKLERQDAMWKLICEDVRVNWEFIPSV